MTESGDFMEPYGSSALAVGVPDCVTTSREEYIHIHSSQLFIYCTVQLIFLVTSFSMFWNSIKVFFLLYLFIIHAISHRRYTRDHSDNESIAGLVQLQMHTITGIHRQLIPQYVKVLTSVVLNI